jgi:hypothetical protein
VASYLLYRSAMRSHPPTPVPDPWASADIDNGWRDLIVSSAPPPVPEAKPAAAPPPPPPMAVMRELGTKEIHLKNQSLPSDLNSWQEHGAARAQEPMVNEPVYSTGDRRLWLVAGTLMALAVAVLGLLGFLTFGNSHVIESALTAVTGSGSDPPAPRAIDGRPAVEAASLVASQRPSRPAVGGVAAAPEPAPAVAPRAPRIDNGALVTITHSASSSSSSSSGSSRHHGSSSKHRHHKSRDTASALP